MDAPGSVCSLTAFIACSPPTTSHRRSGPICSGRPGSSHVRSGVLFHVMTVALAERYSIHLGMSLSTSVRGSAVKKAGAGGGLPLVPADPSG
jgi:hypothetical protein